MARMRFSTLNRFVLPILAALIIGAALRPNITGPAAAQTSNSLPAPHLGYGVHVGPHTGVNPGLVDQLRVDWVKLYDTAQIGQYAHKRILFRVDVGWPGNWAEFRARIQARAHDLWVRGVDAVEIHNEPNLSMEWPRGPNAWEYTQLLRVAYTEIKKVAPQMIVVSGGLAPTLTTGDRQAISDIDFAAEMLDNGAAQWFDAFGYHPYGYNAPPETEPAYDRLVFRRVELIRALFEERGIYDKQIWLTEFGWLRQRVVEAVEFDASDPAFAGFAWLRVPGQTQADYTVRAFDWADRNWPWAGPMFLWNLNWSMMSGETGSPCSHMRWFSILRADGSPLPVFDRVASMPRRISDYQPQLTIYTEDMTGEGNVACPGEIRVGDFKVLNTGYPGQFTATVEPVAPPGGPYPTVYPDTVGSGETVEVYADITGLDFGLYPVYINVTTTIGGEPVAQSIQGYIVIGADVACDG